MVVTTALAATLGKAASDSDNAAAALKDMEINNKKLSDEIASLKKQSAEHELAAVAAADAEIKIRNLIADLKKASVRIVSVVIMGI